jgi:hypothetical protein
MGLRPTHGDEIASMVFVRSKGRDVLVLLFILNKSVILTVVKRSGGTCWGVRALGRKHFQERSVELQIPPLRYASVGMTKGRVALPFRSDAEDDEQQVPPLRYASVGMTILFGVET